MGGCLSPSLGYIAQESPGVTHPRSSGNGSEFPDRWEGNGEITGVPLPRLLWDQPAL